MGKRMNKWLAKREKNRLAAGWGKKQGMKVGEEIAPVMAGVQVGRIAMPFHAGDIMDAVLFGFKPKPVVEGKTFDSGVDFGSRLRKRGYEALGSGCFSTVYAKGDSDKVIKVTRNLDNWIDYIHWASEQGWAGKFAPKVYSYKRFDKAKHPFSVAIVERMDRGFHSVGYEDDAYIISSLMWSAMAGKSLLAQLYLDDMAPGLPKFLLDFKKKFGNSRTDIGGNNMMLRRDGSFCLTDPLAGTSEFKTSRLRSRDFTSLAPAILGITCNTFISAYRKILKTVLRLKTEISGKFIVSTI